MKETLRLDTYSLFEFCQKVQENIIAGWRFDFDSNENAPVSFGSMLTCGMIRQNQYDGGMVKDGVPAVKVEVVPEEPKEEQVKKVTRKAKVVE